MNNQTIEHKWHTLEPQQVLAIVATTRQGLSSQDAKFRLELYGKNELAPFKRPNWLMRFLLQFHNVLIYVLLISAIITLFLGEWVDSSVIFGVVVLSAIFGVIQEGKAERAIEAIREMLAPTAEVIRDGRSISVPASHLVVGDLVLLKSGDKVPADLRLLESKGLQIQEAILTGESNAVDKNVASVAQDAALGDRFGMAYGGTSVTSGRGLGVVIAIGAQTEIGKIGSLLKEIQTVSTPLLRQMDRFGRWLTVAILSVAAVTVLIGIVIWHYPLDQMFMSAVGLAVAAIPEGLPATLTIILAVGVTQMARRNAIIRRLPAVETMGAVTTICTDKTGTLTRNEQSVKRIITGGQCYEIQENSEVVVKIDQMCQPQTGDSFQHTRGEQLDLREQDELGIDPQEHAELLAALQSAVLCNDANFYRATEQESWSIKGNPIDQALLELGIKLRLDPKFLHQANPRSDIIPYESTHKLMATLHCNHDGCHWLYVKGAPEQILTRCRLELGANGSVMGLNQQYWYEQIEALARQGYRMIAIARRELREGQNHLTFNDIEHDLVMVALFALIDAPRTEVAQAVAECVAAKIQVKMITGDHALTALTVAAQVGIDNHGGVLTGNEIDGLSDQELAQAVREVNVYARTSPHHKLRLVEALQANGELVAMTGDGVNDAPALRKADIGVAMGQKGAAIAKESAEMVLADDNFATIVHAIEGGRVVYDNLRKVLLHSLPTNAAEGLVIVMAIVLGVVLPITPVQILWVNMITAVVLSTSLGFEVAEHGVMNLPPRKAKASIISKFLFWRMVLITILLVASVFGVFTLQLSWGANIEVARTVAVNMLVVGEAAYLINCRKLHNSPFTVKNFWDNPKIFIAVVLTLGLQYLFTYLPSMQRLFGTADLSIYHWLGIGLLALLIMGLMEIEKLMVKRWGWIVSRRG